MYTQLISVLALAGASSAAVISRRQADCNTFQGGFESTIGQIQTARNDLIVVLGNVVQNATTPAQALSDIETFSHSLVASFNAVNNNNGTPESVCPGIFIPTDAQMAAAGSAGGPHDTFAFRYQEAQLLQQHVASPLEVVMQDVMSCDGPKAVADFCSILEFYFPQPPSQ